MIVIPQQLDKLSGAVGKLYSQPVGVPHCPDGVHHQRFHGGGFQRNLLVKYLSRDFQGKVLGLGGVFLKELLLVPLQGGENGVHPLEHGIDFGSLLLKALVNALQPCLLHHGDGRALGLLQNGIPFLFGLSTDPLGKLLRLCLLALHQGVKLGAAEGNLLLRVADGVFLGLPLLPFLLVPWVNGFHVVPHGDFYKGILRDKLALLNNLKQ